MDKLTHPGGVIINQLDYIEKHNDKKNAEDFKTCYEKYYMVVFKHAAYLTGDVHAAQDIAQETFVKFYNYTGEIENTGAWLSKVASNLAYNYKRDEKTKRIKQPIIDDNGGSNVISLEDAAIRDFEIRMTRKILDRLNNRDRMCLLLKFSGYKYSEISEILGIEKTSVGKVLARAQEKFKQMYLKEVQD